MTTTANLKKSQVVNIRVLLQSIGSEFLARFNGGAKVKCATITELAVMDGFFFDGRLTADTDLGMVTVGLILRNPLTLEYKLYGRIVASSGSSDGFVQSSSKGTLDITGKTVPAIVAELGKCIKYMKE